MENEIERLKKELERETHLKKLWRSLYDNEVVVSDTLRKQLSDAKSILERM